MLDKSVCSLVFLRNDPDILSIVRFGVLSVVRIGVFHVLYRYAMYAVRGNSYLYACARGGHTCNVFS